MKKLIGLAAIVVFVLAAQAAKPITTGTIAGPAGDVSLGGTVTFPFTFDGKPKEAPRVQVDCYQGETLVWSHSDDAADPVLLGGNASDWVTNGGAASCVALLYWWDFHPVQVFNLVDLVAFEAAG